MDTYLGSSLLDPIGNREYWLPYCQASQVNFCYVWRRLAKTLLLIQVIQQPQTHLLG
jgi:hypothetical protein